MTAEEQRYAVSAIVVALLAIGAAIAGLELGRWALSVIAVVELVLMTRAGFRADRRD